MSETSIAEEEVCPHPIETEFDIGEQNIQPFGLDIHNPVFLISGISIVAPGQPFKALSVLLSLQPGYELRYGLWPARGVPDTQGAQSSRVACSP